MTEAAPVRRRCDAFAPVTVAAPVDLPAPPVPARYNASSQPPIEIVLLCGRKVRVDADILIETCKLNDVDPSTWLADILARIADHPPKRVVDLLPWHRKAARVAHAQAASSPDPTVLAGCLA